MLPSRDEDRKESRTFANIIAFLSNRVSGAIVISLSGLTIILTLVEIGLFAASKLRSTFHLTSACIKAAIWLVYFAITVAGGSALDIILSLAVT
jgi:hypothetical protein